MRLQSLKRLSQVSSAVVTTLLVGSGCHIHKAPASKLLSATAPSTMRFNPATLNSTQPVIVPPATLPTTIPSTEPATLPATMDSTMAATVPASMPVMIPVTMPATMPEAIAVTQPTTMQMSPATLPATIPATLPATAPATMNAAPVPVAPPIADAAPPTDPDQIQADKFLAEQLDSIAELQFAGKASSNDVLPVMLRHQAALLSACDSLSPTGGRFARLVADAMAQLHDRDGESAALLKAITAEPDDEFSWNRRLDLILVPMQTAREKIDYLRDVIGRSAGDVIVPPDVRAHAAFRCAQLLLERGEDDAAKTTIDDALRVCPSSVECLTLRYQLLPADAPRFERCGQLLDLLHANPLQPRYSAELADLVAEAGLVQESLPWYQLAVATAHLRGDPAKQSMLNWAAELFIGDETLDGMRLNTALLQIDSTNAQAYFLQLAMVRSTGDKDALTKALQEATNALSNRVVDAVNAAAPPDAPKATTRPISDESPLELPDLTATVARIKQGVSPRVKQQFVEAVADMAFLEGYFAEDADSASKLIDALSEVLPDNAPELARLRGWNDLLAKKTDDAKAKFAVVAAQDPLAELGLIKTMLDNPTDRPTAESMGRRLLQDHPSGLIGALLWEQLHGEHVRLITTPQADALREAVIQFPSALLDLVNKPQEFYAIRVEPSPVGSFIGEPLLAQVSVQNLSDYDLTIGHDGVLKPELLFMLHPMVEKNPSFGAFDTLAGPTVLGSHNRIDQTVRLDQTQLLAFLNTQPEEQFEIKGTLTSNETVRRVGGYPVQFVKDFFRLSSSLTPEHEQTALSAVTGGRPDQKITGLSLLQRYALKLLSNKDGGMEVRQQAIALIGAIHRAKNDPLLSVSAWAAQCEFPLATDNDRINLVRDLAEDPDWRHRQMALLLLPNLDSSVRDPMIDKLALDTQSSVRADAVALKALLALPPVATTEPAPTPPSDPAQ